MNCFANVFYLFTNSKTREKELQTERIGVMRRLEYAKTSMKQYNERCLENEKSKMKLIEKALAAGNNGIVLVYRNSIKLQRIQIGQFETQIEKFEQLQMLLRENAEHELLFKAMCKARDALNLLKIDKIECVAHIEDTAFEITHAAEQRMLLNSVSFDDIESDEYISKELENSIFPACPSTELKQRENINLLVDVGEVSML